MRAGVAVAAGLAATLIASCTSTPAQEARSPRAARELAETLQGRTPGPPQKCISNYRATTMHVIDDWTIIYRDGRTIWVQNPRGGCRGLGAGGYTLVTRQFGTNQLCDGDINHLVDLSTGMQGSTCIFGPFIPYTRPN